jgi:hypothetical protein
MPFKSEKQRKWMHANEPEMAKKWEKKKKNEAERDYKDEYKKFQSSTKSKKYRAELNKYNRQKGTYGNGDGKDASHKNGKIAGFEAQSKNRGRAEKSRLKKESPDFNPMIDKILDEVIDEYQLNEGPNQMTQIYKDLDKKFKNYDHTRIQHFGKVSKYLKTKFSKGSGLPDAIASFYNEYRGGEDMKKNIAKLTKYAKKMKGYAKESVNEAKLSDEELVKYALYIKKYKPGLWNQMKKNADMKQLIKKFKLEKKESVNEDEMNDIIKLLVKYGNKKSEAIKMAKKHYDYVSKKYKNAKPVKKAEIISSLSTNESVNEAFRPSDKKVLMVIGRDTINKLRKTSPDIDKPSKQLGQAINAIFRAMTREKSDANYKQYKRYFPKNYNEKLLNRLANAYFDQPFNVQNTFMRQVMDYTFKESVDEGRPKYGKLKLTKDKPKKITQRIWSAPKRIMSKRAWLRMPDMNKMRKNGVDYVATSIGPKKTQVYIPVIFESVNEAVSPRGWNMSKKYITFITREVKKLRKYHMQQNEEDFLEVANYIELQIKQMKKDLNESIKEADLGLTYKKGKTVKVKHKTSGKSIVIIDKPNVRKEYEKIGFFAEGSCGYGIDGKVGSQPAGPHLIKKKKKKVNEDVQDLKKVVKELENASKMHLAQSKRIQSHLDDMNVDEKVIKVSKKDDVPGNAMKMSGEEKIKKLVYSGSNGKGSYEIKGKPRDKGFFVRHFTMKTGFRKANLYYDGVNWMDKNKKF